MLKSHHKTVMEILGRAPIHPFPARMAPGIALEALGDTQSPLRVLDPMSGSGTVLAVARANGHHAQGLDIDPLSVLLARVWTRTLHAEEVRECAHDVLSRARKIFKSSSSPSYPPGSDAETRAFIRYWFDDYSRRQLSALAMAIGRVRTETLRDALWCGFSRLIITKQAGASLAMDLSHSRPHRAFTRAPVKPFTQFLAAVERIIANCPQLGNGNVGPRTSVAAGDARNLTIKDRSIDLVLTSPPYLNAIDYMRCSKFSLVWMGYNISPLREIRTRSVGTEARSEQAMQEGWIKALIKDLSLQPKLTPRYQALLATYAWDMDRAMSEVARVLYSHGRAVYVVGESTCQGTYIRNSVIVTRIGERHGLKLIGRHSRSLPANRRYLPPPRRGSRHAKLDARMRREVIVELQKSG